MDSGSWTGLTDEVRKIEASPQVWMGPRISSEDSLEDFF